MNASTLSRFFRRAPLFAAVFGVIATSAYAQNPQEEAGHQHNVYLDCLRKVDPAMERNPFETLIRQCGFDPQGDAGEFIRVNTELMPRDLLQPVAVILEPHRERFTDEQYSYLLRMEEVLSTARSVDDARRGLEALEAEAVERLAGERGNEGILGALSISRYSLEYWVGSGEVFKAKAKWWQIVIADAVGGAVGSLGGPAGVVGLGAACSGAVAAN